jgi:hypothetical protein
LFVNGRVTFKSDAVFNDHVSRLRSLNEDEKKSELLKIGNFTSMYDKYSNLSDEEKTVIVNNGGSDVVYLKHSEGEDGIEAFPQLTDNVLNRLVNSEGLVLIDNKAVKYEWGKEITFNPFSEEKLVAYQNGQSDIGGVSISNVDRSNLRDITASNDRQTAYNYFESKKRLKVYYDYDNINGGYYTALTVETKVQKRVAWVWWAETVNKVRTQCSMLSLNATGTDENEVVYTIDRNGYWNNVNDWMMLVSGSVSFSVNGYCRVSSNSGWEEITVNHNRPD